MAFPTLLRTPLGRPTGTITSKDVAARGRAPVGGAPHGSGDDLTIGRASCGSATSKRSSTAASTRVSTTSSSDIPVLADRLDRLVNDLAPVERHLPDAEVEVVEDPDGELTHALQMHWSCAAREDGAEDGGDPRALRT